MGSRHTGTLRGVATFDRRWTRDAVLEASSSYTERGPRPGTPDPQGTARIIGRFSAAQSTDGYLQMQRQGYPGPDSAMAAYGYDAGEPIGWNPPNWISDHAVVEWTTTNAHDVHDMTTLPDSQRPLCVYIDDTNELLKSRTWSYGSDAWGSAVTMDTEGTDAIGQSFPVAVEAIAEDHVLAFAIFGTASPGTSALLRSSDKGASWDRVAVDVIDSDETWWPKARMRYQPRSGQLVLVAPYDSGSGVYWLRQWVSDDLGTFRFVDDLEVDAEGKFALEATPDGGFVLVYANPSGEVYQRRIADGADSFERAPEEELDTTNTVAELESSRDADGKIWLFGRSSAAAGEWFQWATVDSAANWTQLTYSFHDSQDANQYIDNVAVTHALGGAWVNYQPVSAASTSMEGSLMTAVIGGWSQATTNRATNGASLLTGRSGSGAAVSGLNDSLLWLPYEQFTLCAGLSATGGGVDTVADGVHNVTTTAGTSLTVTASPGSGRPFWAGIIYCDSGHPLGNWMRVWCRASNLAIYLRYDRAKFELWDNDTTKIGSTVNVDLTEPMWVWLERGSGDTFILVYGRPWSTTRTVITGTLGQTAGAGTEVGFGCTVTQTTDSFYGPVTLGSLLTGGGSGAPANKRFGILTGDDVHGKGLGGTPYPIPDLGERDDPLLTNELLVAARVSLQRGPAGIGDVVNVPASYDYPLSRLFPTEEPGLEPWRSEDDNVEEYVAVQMNSSENHGFRSTSLALLVHSTNVRSMFLQGYNGSTYVDIAEWDASLGSAAGTATGEVVVPGGSSSTINRYLQHGEFVGRSGVGGTISKGGSFYEIVQQTAGRFDNTVSGQKAIIHAPGISAAAGAGACELFHHSGIVIVHDVDLSAYEHFRLRIPAQVTPQGYYEIGMVAPAAIVVPGRQWDWTWTEGMEFAHTESGGGRRAHRREELRPPPRTVSISNQDGYLLQSLRGDDPDPNYLSADSGDPLAFREAAPFTWFGLAREIGGDPVLLLKQIPNTDTIITDPSLWLYGHQVSAPAWESIRGDEGVNEHIRLSSITFREITSEKEES